MLRLLCNFLKKIVKVLIFPSALGSHCLGPGSAKKKISERREMTGGLGRVKELGSLCSTIFFPFFLDTKPGLRLGSQIGGLVICKK